MACRRPVVFQQNEDADTKGKLSDDEVTSLSRLSKVDASFSFEESSLDAHLCGDMKRHQFPFPPILRVLSLHPESQGAAPRVDEHPNRTTGHDLTRLLYLDAVCKEKLRLYVVHLQIMIFSSHR